MPNVATTRMSSKGQVVIPEDIRKQLKLKAGSQFVRNFAFSLLEGDQESLERQILQGNQVGKGKES